MTDLAPALAKLTALVNAGCMNTTTAMEITSDLTAGLAADKIKLWSFEPAKRLESARINVPMTIMDRFLTLADDLAEVISDKLQVRLGHWTRLNNRWFLDGSEVACNIL